MGHRRWLGAIRGGSAWGGAPGCAQGRRSGGGVEAGARGGRMPGLL